MNQKPRSLGFLQERRWRLAGGLLVVIGVGLVLLLVQPGTVVQPLVELASLPRGEWLGDDPIFAFFDEITSISIDEHEGLPVLRVVNQKSERYSGFGFVGSFDVPPTAELELEWRGKVRGPPPSLHVVDGSPGRVRADGGEVFTTVAPPVSEHWQTVRVALAGFRKDPEQFADAPNDGVLDSQGISNVEVGLPESTVVELEIRRIAFHWQEAIGPTLVTVLLGCIAGGVLLTRARRLRLSEELFVLSYGIDTAALVYPLVCLALAGSVLFDRYYSLSLAEAFAFGVMLALPVLDELVGRRPQQLVVWGFRYVLLLSGVWWVGAGIEPLSASVLLLIALLPVAMVHGSKLVPVAVVLPMAAILLQPPLDELASKGLWLLYIVAAAVLAMGISEFLRGSDIRQQHERAVMMYRGILEQISDGVVLVDPEGRIELANRGFERLLGAGPGGLQDRQITELLAAPDGSAVAAPDGSAVAPDGQALALSEITPGGKKTELMLINPQTGRRCVALASAHVIRQVNLADHLQLIVTDISDRKRMERELERANKRLQRLSATDELTGLDNRRAIEEALDNEWHRCSRNRLPLSLMYCDIDAFKAYNDCYGHQAGDRVLRQVADILATQIKRPGDRVARFGGEEFLVLLPDTDVSNIESFAEEVRLAVERLGIDHPASPVTSVLTMSIGVAACVPKQGREPEELVHAADMALYVAKSGGRNRVVIHGSDSLPPTEAS